jgi:hypothetical protein
MSILILLCIAVLYLFLKDAYEATEDLIGMRWTLFVLTAIVLGLIIVIGHKIIIFLQVFKHWTG